MSSKALIEIQGSQGATQVLMPPKWTIHDVTVLRHVMELAGYEQASTTTPGEIVFAFAPSVEPDELGTVFDDVGC